MGKMRGTGSIRAVVYLELEKGWCIEEDPRSSTNFFLVHCGKTQLTGHGAVICGKCGSIATDEATGFLKLCRWR